MRIPTMTLQTILLVLLVVITVVPTTTVAKLTDPTKVAVGDMVW
jgi:hypothetical protein